MSTLPVRRSYTAEQKATFLAIFTANGNNLSRSARQAGVPRKTAARWIAGQARDAKNPEDAVALRQEKMEALACSMREIAEQCLELLPGALQKASAQQLAIVMGICTDKALLLSGQPTSRSETVTDKRDRQAMMARLRECYGRVNPNPRSVTLTAEDVEEAQALLANVRPRSESLTPEVVKNAQARLEASRPVTPPAQAAPTPAVVTVVPPPAPKRPAKVVYVGPRPTRLAAAPG